MKTWTKYFILHISALSWIPLIIFGLVYFLFNDFTMVGLSILSLMPIWIICMNKMGEEEYKEYQHQIEMKNKGNHKIYKGVQTDEC